MERYDTSEKAFVHEHAGSVETRSSAIDQVKEREIIQYERVLEVKALNCELETMGSGTENNGLFELYLSHL